MKGEYVTLNWTTAASTSAIETIITVVFSKDYNTIGLGSTFKSAVPGQAYSTPTFNFL